MNARERAEAWYRGYDADDKGELLEGLAAQFEAAEREAWNAAKRVWRKRAEQAEAELVKAQSRVIAGAVYEKLDSINYWKTRAEQAEAALGATINQRNEAERFANENADMVDKFVCLFQMANFRKRVRQAEIRTMIRKLAQAEADARALATAATTSKMLRSNYENELIAKYLEAK